MGLTVLVAMGLSGVGIVAAILIGNAPTVFAPIVGTTWAVLIILGTAVLLTSRITLTSHEIVVRGLFVRQRRPRSHITRAMRATIHMPNGGAGESLFLLDAHGKLLTRVNVAYYKRENVDRLVETLDVPSSGPTYFASGKEFDKTHPGLLSWAERHPYRIPLAILGTALAATVAVALIVITTSS
ncbi:hypothetical protein [Actinomadura syzygii]|uniref:PH domain-containing protein n=2 Tax=Actinomadura syzygii TaxID=1427538 RepID=A0A5D0UKL2_9ACTN|nr:hypothetical protein FXF65_00765 [Actinomadura syzygii]